MPTRASAWVVAVLGGSACVGGQTGESPGEPPRSHSETACGSAACPRENPSAEELNGFGKRFGVGTRDYEILESVDEAVLRPTFIATGWLAGVEHGRKEYIGDLCVPESMEEDERAEQVCVRYEKGYASYVNLVIEVDRVLRGELPVPEEPLRMEFHWPNNLPIDELVERAPIGARLVVLSEWVRNARAQAEPLVQAGIVPPGGGVADNLLASAPYGLAFEDAEGLVAAAFEGEDLARLLDPSGGPVRFEELVGAIQAAVEE